MNTNQIIATLAFSVGFVQLFAEFKRADSVSDEHRNPLILAIIGSALWLTYQYREYGMNMTTLSTTAGLVVQLYILLTILRKERILKDKKED